MTECPACGQQYHAHLEIASGDRAFDVFPAPPYSLFKKYARVCADPESYKQAQYSAKSCIDLYFHTYTDLGHPHSGI